MSERQGDVSRERRWLATRDELGCRPEQPLGVRVRPSCCLPRNLPGEVEYLALQLTPKTGFGFGSPKR
jgi:hypothetical protein